MEDSVKNIVISGASGYIGKRLLKILDNGDYNVIALCSNKESIDLDSGSGIKVMENDEFLNSDIKMENGFLLNLAFPRKNDMALLLNLFRFTYKLYDKCLSMGCKYFINISSQSIYDINRTSEAFEDSYTMPFNLYGLAKVYMENYTEDFSIKNNVSYLNLRLGSIVGPNFDIRINNKLIKSYVNNEDIVIEDDGFKYAFIHIDDANNCFKSVVDNSAKIEWNSTLNVGSNFSYGILEIYNDINRRFIHKYTGKVLIKDVEKMNKTNKVNIDKINDQIGWTPSFNLEKINDSICFEEFGI